MHTVAPAHAACEMNARTALPLLATAAIFAAPPPSGGGGAGAKPRASKNSKRSPATPSSSAPTTSAKPCEVCQGTGLRRESERDCAACGGLGTAPRDTSPEQIERDRRRAARERDGEAPFTRAEAERQVEAARTSWEALSEDDRVAWLDERLERASRAADRRWVDDYYAEMGSSSARSATAVLERIAEHDGVARARLAFLDALGQVLDMIVLEHDIAHRSAVYGWIGIATNYCSLFCSALDEDSVFKAHALLAELDRAKVAGGLGPIFRELIDNDDWSAVESLRHYVATHESLCGEEDPAGLEAFAETLRAWDPTVGS